MDLQKLDILNNQFSIDYYLKQNFENDAVTFAKENMININHIGFISLKVQNMHYIITTSIKRDPDSGYRLITIKYASSENSVTDNRKYNSSSFIQFNINYDNVNITVSKKYDDLKYITQHIPNLDNINNRYLPSKNLVTKFSTVDFSMRYYKDMDVNPILKLENAIRLYQLYLFPNLQWVTFSKSCNLVVKENMFPQTLLRIDFNDEFNQYIGKNVLPPLTVLTFGKYYDKLVDNDTFSSCSNTLQVLKFTKNYKRIITKDTITSIYTLKQLEVSRICYPKNNIKTLKVIYFN